MAIVNNLLIDMIVSDYQKALPLLDMLSINLRDKITYCYESQITYRDLSIFSWLHHSAEPYNLESIWNELKTNSDNYDIKYMMNDLIDTCLDTINIKLFSLSLENCKNILNEDDYYELKESILLRFNSEKEIKKIEYILINNHFYEESFREKIIKKLINYGDPRMVLSIAENLNLKNKKEFFGYALVKFYRDVVFCYDINFLGKNNNILIFLIKNNFSTEIEKTDFLFEEIDRIRHDCYSSRYYNELMYQGDFFQKGESVSHMLNTDLEYFIELKEICVAFESKLLSQNIVCETNKKEKERL